MIGAIIAYVSRRGPKVNAVVMAAGDGLLLGSVAYDLIEEALKSSSLLWVAASFFLGSAVFVIGDLVLDRMGAAKRKDPNGEQADGSAKAIVMGSVLDGIPESFVLGLTVLQGGVLGHSSAGCDCAIHHGHSWPSRRQKTARLSFSVGRQMNVGCQNIPDLAPIALIRNYFNASLFTYRVDRFSNFLVFCELVGLLLPSQFAYGICLWHFIDRSWFFILPLS